MVAIAPGRVLCTRACEMLLPTVQPIEDYRYAKNLLTTWMEDVDDDAQIAFQLPQRVVVFGNSISLTWFPQRFSDSGRIDVIPLSYSQQAFRTGRPGMSWYSLAWWVRPL
eukprot:16450134-Heterocapsa_arctica.AAC.1